MTIGLPPPMIGVLADTELPDLGPEADALGHRLEGERAYRLIGRLGEGGMGRVFLAERADGEFRQQVAIKLLAWFLDGDEEAARRFRAERQILARLNHPNIARLLDGGTTAQGQPYLVMEHVPGERIDAYAERRHLATRQRVDLCLKVCDAVRVAHQNLVIHRDLKPGNILVTAEGEPKLLDFGIAKLLAPDPAGEGIETAHGEMLLTPRYASPEQMRGEAITTASDVYALGVVFFELLTGRSPYKPESLGLLRLPTAVCEEIPEPPSVVAPDRRRDIGHELDAVVLKALRKEPADRYPSVEALADDLRAWREGRPVGARADTGFYRLRKFLGRHRWAAAGAALSALLLIGWALTLRQQLVRTEAERHRAERARELLIDVVGGSDSALSRSRDLTVRQFLDDAVGRVRGRTDDPLELRESLLGSLGRVYLSLGMLEEADGLLVETLARGMPWARPEERARIQLALARLRYQQGSDETIDLTQKALSDDGDRLDPATRMLLLTVLGRALVKGGYFAEAEAAQRESLAIGRASRFDGAVARPEMVEALVNYGLMLSMSRPITNPEAANALVEALEVERRLPTGLADPWLRLRALENLAWVYLDAGDWKKAEPLVAEAEDVAGTALGEDHPAVVDIRNYRVLVEWRRGNYAAAERMLAEILSRHPEQRGYILHERLRANLGGMIALQGRFDEGLPLIESSLAEHRRIGTSGYGDVFYDLWILALNTYDRGELARARGYADQADVEARRLPHDRPYLPLALVYRGAAAAWLDGPDAGEADLRQGVERQRAILPSPHPDAVFGLAELAALRLRQGRVDEAAALTREAVAIAPTLPAAHWDAAFARAVDAALRLQRGDAGARAALNAELPILVARHGESHPRVRWLRGLAG